MDELAHLRRKIGDVLFPHPILVGAGVFKTAEDMLDVASSSIIPVWGSLTTKENLGNKGLSYHAEYVEMGGVRVLINTQNARLLPNPGIEYAEHHAPKIKQTFADHEKPLVMSIWGEDLWDRIYLIERLLRLGADIVIVNGACPNRIDEKQAPIPMLCYDTDALDALFALADERIGQIGKPIFLKISMGMPRNILAHIRTKIAESKTFMGVVCGNTVPNTLNFTEEGETTIKTGDGVLRGGMGGPAILPVALDHTQFMAEGMPTGKVVVGCGGISTAKDAVKHFRAGAKLVKLVSAFLESEEKTRFMDNLVDELGTLLKQKMEMKNPT